MKNSIYSEEHRELCHKLVKAREDAGLTQKQVEDSIEFLQSELSKIENGQRKISFLLLLRLARLYEKPLDYFVPDALK